jgi:hypothetical protein
MRHLLRLVPALLGAALLASLIAGAHSIAGLCRILPSLEPATSRCHAFAQHPFIQNPIIIAVAAVALIALTLALLMQWQRGRRTVSYDSDAGRWIVLGWVLAIGGTASLMAGLILIGSNGWPFSHQSRHISVRTGQLPLSISTVQRRYFANYSGGDGLQSHCASFGEVTMCNRSRYRSLDLDLALLVTPRDRARAVPQTAMPTRDDLIAIARRGLVADAVFRGPVMLAPRQSLRRELVFVVRHAADGGLSDSDHVFSLAVKDRLSGQTVSFSLPAEYRG